MTPAMTMMNVGSPSKKRMMNTGNIRRTPVFQPVQSGWPLSHPLRAPSPPSRVPQRGDEGNDQADQQPDTDNGEGEVMRRLIRKEAGKKTLQLGGRLPAARLAWRRKLKSRPLPR